MRQRSDSVKQYQNNFQFYEAVVYDYTSTSSKEDGGDDRYQLRILPNMANIPAKYARYFPRFPFLNWQNKPALKTEKEYGENADIVLVMCSWDFTIGYIISGPKSGFPGNKVDEIQQKSWPFQNMKSILSEAHDEVKDSFGDYKDITVDAWGEGNGGGSTGGEGQAGNIQAGYVICHNEKNGAMYWINGSGAMMSLGPDYFTVRVAKANSGGDGSAFGEIHLNNSGDVLINCHDFIVTRSGSMELGQGGLSICGSVSPLPGDANGKDIISDTSITF